MTVTELLAAERVLIMGVLNVTPDSFSDGGRFERVDDAVAHAARLVAAGADLIDVGGESTRPGSEGVEPDLEQGRVLEVVTRIATLGPPVSIDTRHASVANAALAAGAALINDVAGLRDPAMVDVAVRHRAPVVVVHSPVDDPAVMQRHARYDDVVGEVGAFLRTQAERALAAGVPAVVIDPGIGFGKTTAHNLELLRRLDELVAIGPPVLVGASRKRFIGELSGESRPDRRDAGTLAAHLAAIAQGARIVRVHDVAAHRQAIDVWAAIGPPPRLIPAASDAPRAAGDARPG